MPSPFPGMDPYLENQEIWPDLHHRLITAIAERLQPQLRPRYHSRIDARLVIEESPPRQYRPDVTVSEVSDPQAVYATDAATALSPDEPTIVRAVQDPIRQGFIEIHSPRGGEVVTVIEVLSPSNKRPGPGRDDYRQKQRDLMDSGISLVEIDLLRHGDHTLAAPQYTLRELSGDYWVCVHRAGAGSEFEIYAVPLRQRLPRVKVPLRKPDPDVVLDLPSVFAQCYDAADYGAEIDYRVAPAVPLLPDDETWAGDLLRTAGLRPDAT